MGVAFLDVGVYVTSLRVLKNLLLIGDAVKSVWLVAFQVYTYVFSLGAAGVTNVDCRRTRTNWLSWPRTFGGRMRPTSTFSSPTANCRSFSMTKRACCVCSRMTPAVCSPRVALMVMIYDIDDGSSMQTPNREAVNTSCVTPSFTATRSVERPARSRDGRKRTMKFHKPSSSRVCSHLRRRTVYGPLTIPMRSVQAPRTVHCPHSHPPMRVLLNDSISSKDSCCATCSTSRVSTPEHTGEWTFPSLPSKSRCVRTHD